MNSLLRPQTVNDLSKIKSYKMIDNSECILQQEVSLAAVDRGDLLELTDSVDACYDILPANTMLVVERVNSKGIYAKILSEQNFNSTLYIPMFYKFMSTIL